MLWKPDVFITTPGRHSTNSIPDTTTTCHTASPDKQISDMPMEIGTLTSLLLTVCGSCLVVGNCCHGVDSHHNVTDLVVKEVV